MSIFFSVMFPIIIIFASGFLLQRIRVVDVRSVAAVSIYIFMPIFFFISLYEAEFDEDYLVILIALAFILSMMILINKILAKVFNWSRSIESASIIGSAFMNGGNYGIPLIVFALGSHATHYAVFFMVMQSLIIQFFGVYYASRSSSGVMAGIRQVFRMPATYACLLAFLFKFFSIELPTGIYDTLKMVSGGSIPLMMIVLGMQLATIHSFRFNWQVMTSSVVIRMIISPLITFIFLLFFDVQPLVAQVILIMSAMPSAASAAMFAIEFDTEPKLVSSVMLVTTVFSFISLTFLLNFLI